MFSHYMVLARFIGLAAMVGGIGWGLLAVGLETIWVGIACLVSGGMGILHAVYRFFVRDIRTYADIEAQAIAKLQEIGGPRQGNPGKRTELPDQLMERAKPLWEEANQSVLAMLQHATGSRRRALQMVQRYTQARVLQMDLIAEAIRNDDAEKAAWAQFNAKKIDEYAAEAGKALKVLRFGSLSALTSW